jgi:hypothetical protein
VVHCWCRPDAVPSLPVARSGSVPRREHSRVRFRRCRWRGLRRCDAARVTGWSSLLASSSTLLRSLSCSRTQTPAPCQSRSRRQQVEPLPQPSAWGNSRHGQPVRSTKMMPLKAIRSGTRGRPPFGFAGSSGNNGSISSQRASGTRGSLLARTEYLASRWSLETCS